MGSSKDSRILLAGVYKLFCNSIAEETSLLCKETKALAVSSQQRNIVASFVLERMLSWSHTWRSKEDWIAPSTEVKFHASQNVLLCQIRTNAWFAACVACLRKNTAASFPDCVLWNKVKPCSNHGVPVASSFHVRNSLWRDSYTLLGSLEQKPLILLFGRILMCQAEITMNVRCPGPDPALQKSLVSPTQGF